MLEIQKNACKESREVLVFEYATTLDKSFVVGAHKFKIYKCIFIRTKKGHCPRKLIIQTIINHT